MSGSPLIPATTTDGTPFATSSFFQGFAISPSRVQNLNDAITQATAAAASAQTAATTATSASNTATTSATSAASAASAAVATVNSTASTATAAINSASTTAVNTVNAAASAASTSASNAASSASSASSSASAASGSATTAGTSATNAASSATAANTSATNAANSATAAATSATNAAASATSASNTSATMTANMASYAPLASPALTGVPTAPTAGVNTNNTQIATTAYVLANTSVSTPTMDSAGGSAGTSPRFARADHVHPSDTSRAPLASPALTGAPTAPTPAQSDSSTAIATTAFVQNALIGGPSQSWQNVGASRALATTYTNSTARAIFISVSVTAAVAGGNLMTPIVGGVGLPSNDFYSSSNGYIGNVTIIVPAGQTYSVTVNGTSTPPSLSAWFELR